MGRWYITGDKKMIHGKKILTSILLLLCVFPQIWGQSFNAISPSGHMLAYYILYDTNECVAVGKYGAPYFGDPYSIDGDLIIPSTVTNGGTTYSVIKIVDDYYGRNFSGCTGLTSVTMPNSIIRIGREAFKNCSNLTSVTIPNSVIEIGPRAFLRTGLTSLTIPENVEDAGEDAFACPNLDTLRLNARRLNMNCGDRNLFGSVIDLSRAYISDLTIGDRVEYIPDYFLYDDTLLTAVTFPSSVKNIGDRAFYDTRLDSIIIPATIDSIGECAFCTDGSLVHVTYLPANLVYHLVNGGSAFGFIFSDESDRPTASQTLTIGNGVNELPSEIFSDMNIFSVDLPNSLHGIGNYTFKNCRLLTSIMIPDSANIGNGAFRDCSGLDFVTIGNSVTTIGEEAFYACTSLRRINIPEGITSIRNSTFMSCTSLDSVIIPEGINTIEPFSFGNCFSLHNIIIPNSVTSVEGSSFINCTSLESVVIGDGLSTIGSSVFNRCTSLTDVFIGDGVSTIDNLAFYSSPIQRLTIGASVSNIGYSAFRGITNPDTIFIRATVPPTINFLTFENMSSDAPIILPCGTIDDYTNAEDWNVFTNMSEPDTCESQFVDDIEATTSLIYVNDGQLVIEGAEGLPVRVFDAVGREVESWAAASGRTRTSALPGGVYLVRIGDAPARRIVVVR